MAQNVRKIATGAGAALLILSVLSAPRIASSAEYPRRIAIVPFVNLTGQDEIKPVVSVLPRPLSTRLMALAGAETTLLPAGEKGPEEAAKEAKVPLLLQGTVSKLGRGTASTRWSRTCRRKARRRVLRLRGDGGRDHPAVGVMAPTWRRNSSGEGVASAAGRRLVPAAPAPAPPLPPRRRSPPRRSRLRRRRRPPDARRSPRDGRRGALGPWDPKRIEKVGMSDKIPDTIFRVSAGDVDGDGVPEVAAIGLTGCSSTRSWTTRPFLSGSGRTTSPTSS